MSTQESHWDRENLPGFLVDVGSEKLRCWKQCGHHQSCNDLVINLVNNVVNDLVNVIFSGDLLILLAVK